MKQPWYKLNSEKEAVDLTKALLDHGIRLNPLLSYQQRESIITYIKTWWHDTYMTCWKRDGALIFGLFYDSYTQDKKDTLTIINSPAQFLSYAKRMIEAKSNEPT